MAQGSATEPVGQPRGRLLLLFLLLLLTAACRGQIAQASDAKVSLEITPTPYVTGPAQVAVTILDPSGEPVRGAKVSVEGNMSHAGMVPVLSEARETAAGVYVTHDYRWTMGGDWFITVRVTPANGAPFERVFDVKGVTGDKMMRGNH